MCFALLSLSSWTSPDLPPYPESIAICHPSVSHKWPMGHAKEIHECNATCDVITWCTSGLDAEKRLWTPWKQHFTSDFRRWFAGVYFSTRMGCVCTVALLTWWRCTPGSLQSVTTASSLAGPRSLTWPSHRTNWWGIYCKKREKARDTRKIRKHLVLHPAGFFVLNLLQFLSEDRAAQQVEKLTTKWKFELALCVPRPSCELLLCWFSGVAKELKVLLTVHFQIGATFSSTNVSTFIIDIQRVQPLGSEPGSPPVTTPPPTARYHPQKHEVFEDKVQDCNGTRCCDNGVDWRMYVRKNLRQISVVVFYFCTKSAQWFPERWSGSHGSAYARFLLLTLCLRNLEWKLTTFVHLFQWKKKFYCGETAHTVFAVGHMILGCGKLLTLVRCGFLRAFCPSPSTTWRVCLQSDAKGADRAFHPDRRCWWRHYLSRWH